MITAATGHRPVYRAGAWVWAAINRSAPSLVTSPSKLAPCISTGTEAISAVDTALACLTTTGTFMRVVGPVDAALRMVSRIVLRKGEPLVTIAAATASATRVEFVVTGDNIRGSVTLPARRFIYGPLAGWTVSGADTHMADEKSRLRSVAYDATGILGQSPEVALRVDTS